MYMRKLLLILLALPTVCSAQSLIWGDVKVVIEELSMGYARPKIHLDANNEPVVMWGRATNREVFVSTMNNGAFGAPVMVTPDGGSAYVQSWTGPSLATRGDSVFVAYKSMPDMEGFVYVRGSLDGGKTFGDTVRIPNDSWARFPEVSIGPDGQVVVDFMKFEPGFMEPHYATSVSWDGGQTFSEPLSASGGAVGEACDCCPGFVLADGDRIVVMFRNNDSDLRDMWVSVSEDGGVSYVGADVDNNNWMISSCPSTGPEAILLGDSLYMAWMSGATGYSRVNVGKVNLTNLSSAVNYELTPNAQSNQNYPKVAGNKDVLGVVYQESAAGNTDIRFAFSTTGVEGLMTMSAELVNVDLLGTQMNPDVVYANGMFHFVWQDQKSKAVLYRSAQVDFTSEINQEQLVRIGTVFPNPATNKLSVSGKGFFEIFSMDGSLMFSGDGNEVDIKAWPVGAYVLKGNTGYSQRFVKE
ncbi:MAG: hypothetical protein ACI9YL_000431 [Luteibaculaceae bacterium]|jgi:hypothetical protein